MNYQRALKAFEQNLTPEGLENARSIVEEILSTGLDAKHIRYLDESTVFLKGKTYVIEPDEKGGVQFKGDVGPQFSYVAGFFLLAPDFTRDGPLLKNGEPFVELIEIVETLKKKRAADILPETTSNEIPETPEKEQVTESIPEETKGQEPGKRGRKPKKETQEEKPEIAVEAESSVPETVRPETVPVTAARQDTPAYPKASDVLQKIRDINVPTDLTQLVMTSDGSTLELLPWVETLSLLQDTVPTFSVIREEVTYGHGRVVVTVVGEIPTAEGPLRMSGIGISSTLAGEPTDGLRPAPEYLAHAAAFNRMAMMFGLRRDVWRHRAVSETAGSFEPVKQPAIAPVPAPTPGPYIRPKAEAPQAAIQPPPAAPVLETLAETVAEPPAAPAPARKGFRFGS